MAMPLMALESRPQKPLPSSNPPRQRTLSVTRSLKQVRRPSRRVMQLRRSSWDSGACKAVLTSSPCQLSSWPAPSLPNMLMYIHALHSGSQASHSPLCASIPRGTMNGVCTWISQRVGKGPAVVPQAPPPTVMARKARQSMPLPMTQKTPPIRFAVCENVVNS